jgi:LPS sulfotransferase NodH
MMLQSIKNAVFRAATRLFPCDLRDTIVVTGSPRSGTTWLLELLRALPGYKALNEPLMYEEARHELGFSWRTYLNPKEEADEQRAYLETILTGQLGISPAWYFEAASRPA